MGKVPLGYIHIICGGFRRIEYIIQLKYSNSSDVFLMYREQLQSAYAFSVSPTFHIYAFNKKECYSVL